MNHQIHQRFGGPAQARLCIRILGWSWLLALPPAALAGEHDADWPMFGQSERNTANQSGESRISVEVDALYNGPACTADDTAVYFRDLKVMAVGDLFVDGPPDAAQVCAAPGGSYASWAKVLGKLLELDFDIVVPAVGQPVSRAQFDALRQSLIRRADTP